MAKDRSSDAALEKKVLGYWTGPRWVQLYKADGLKYPISAQGVKCHWDIKGGIYYEASQPCDILVLTDKKFVYRFRGGETISYSKLSKKEGELRAKLAE